MVEVTSLLTMDDIKAISLLERKFFEYTADNCRKAKGLNYICDNEIKHAFDYKNIGDKNYIGITCRFLYNQEAESIVGFKVYELFKGVDFVEGFSTIDDGIVIGEVHEFAFAGGFKTIKLDNNVFRLGSIDRKHPEYVQSFVEII